jgi:hypothetical protein
MTIIHNCPECGFTHSTGAGEQVRCRVCERLFSSPDSPPSVAGLPIFLHCPICQTELRGVFLETVSCAQCRASYRLDEDTIESLNPHITTVTVKNTRTCPRCGMANLLVASHCEGCGQGLGPATAPAPPPRVASRPAPAAPAVRPPAPRPAIRTSSWSPEPKGSMLDRMGFLGGLGAGAAVAALVLIIILLLALSSRSRSRRLQAERARVEKVTREKRVPGGICVRCDGWGYLYRYTPTERQCPDCKGTGHNP